jgi:lipoate-protein ligase B
VWAGGSKIAAIGVRVQGGVTTHGFALNVAPDLSWFDAIVPCGLSGVAVTSLQKVLGRPVDLPSVEDAMLQAFESVFDSHVLYVGARHAPAQGICQVATERSTVGVS